MTTLHLGCTNYYDQNLLHYVHHGILPNGNPQPLYFPEDDPDMPGWFKGMEIIIHEHGLWPRHADLLAQCPKFHCPLAVLTAVVGEFFICSLISCHRSPSFKSWLSLAATSAIFTPSITASSTLSSSTGEWPSCISIC